MSLVQRKLRPTRSGYLFWCPGCKESHGVSVGPNGWRFNGDEAAPAFSPSAMVRRGHFAEHFKPGMECWCTHNAELVAKGEKATPFRCGTCHSYVGGSDGSKPGFIEFLHDCSHELAGQTVPLPDYPIPPVELPGIVGSTKP